MTFAGDFRAFARGALTQRKSGVKRCKDLKNSSGGTRKKDRDMLPGEKNIRASPQHAWKRPQHLRRINSKTKKPGSSPHSKSLKAILQRESQMIHIDHREPEAIVRILGQTTETTLRSLTVGDYITPQGAIERKTIPDFLASLASRRIFSQTGRLAAAYRTRYLLIEGLLDWSALKNPKWVTAAMQRITINQGVPILFTASMEDTSRMLIKMSRPLSTIEPCDIIPAGPKARSLPRQQESLLMRLPGIGAKRANRCLRVFETPRAFFIARPKELREAGIGAKTRRAIREVMDTPYEPE